MAEVLAVAGGFASFAQILTYAVKTANVLMEICQDMKDAPVELRSIRDRVILIRAMLEGFERDLPGLDHDTLLPPDLRLLLRKAIHSVWEAIVSCQHGFHAAAADISSGKRLKGRLKWALTERQTMDKLLERLKDAESTLTCALGLLNYRNTSITCRHSVELLRTVQVLADTTQLPASLFFIEQNRQAKEGHINAKDRETRKALKTWPLCFVLGRDTWLKKLGFIACFVLASTVDGRHDARIFLGYKLPTSISSRAIILDLHFSILSLTDISILPGYLRAQNLVSQDTLFMNACRSGDITLIRQHINSGTGRVSDRTLESGKTPLLLAIESTNLEAIQYLLEAGADPNTGDDQRILPIFAALGLQGNPHPCLKMSYLQRSPTTTIWLDILRILVRHGASVHEVVGTKSLATLNTVMPNYTENITASFFALLHSECYADFEVVDNIGSSALLNALRTRKGAAEALRMLKKAGVNMSKVFEDGRTILHLAAEMSDDVGVLRLIYDAFSVQEVNRQDKWGWTPLHYSVISRVNCMKGGSCAKVQFLLEKGADPNVRGQGLPIFRTELGQELSPYELSSTLCPGVHMKFTQALQAAGYPSLADFQEDIFYDAVEQITKEA